MKPVFGIVLFLDYCSELKRFLLDPFDLSNASVDEQTMVKEFGMPGRVWTGGNRKMSLCYLLLDPRVWSPNTTRIYFYNCLYNNIVLKLFYFIYN